MAKGESRRAVLETGERRWLRCRHVRGCGASGWTAKWIRIVEHYATEIKTPCQKATSGVGRNLDARVGRPMLEVFTENDGECTGWMGRMEPVRAGDGHNQGDEDPSHDPACLIPGRGVDTLNAVKGRGGEIQPGMGRQIRILGLEVRHTVEGHLILDRVTREIELEG